MSRIFWDTNLFIYFLEGNTQESLTTRNLRGKMLARGDQLLTSTITLGEILVKPLEQGNTTLCRNYEDAITKTASLLSFDAKAAWKYAEIRCDRSVRAPDAVQLACAASANTDLFVTNDRRLQGKRVDGIQFIVALDQVPI
ncbi:MAG TPA: type II toxin-antitoxin system VapC family toxin [Terriglobales bacterium]|nr:type II toxin-antitoxin system VapC family toxin [Terriglobales bacterium]